MADQNSQLDLKKVELKRFCTATDLIRYDNQTEVDETRLTAVRSRSHELLLETDFCGSKDDLPGSESHRRKQQLMAKAVL